MRDIFINSQSSLTTPKELTKNTMDPFNEQRSLLNTLNIYLTNENGSLKIHAEKYFFGPTSKSGGFPLNKEEFDLKIIDDEKIMFKSNYTEGIEIFHSKGGFTLQQFLDAIVNFEKIENETPGINSSWKVKFYEGLEKISPKAYQIKWSLV